MRPIVLLLLGCLCGLLPGCSPTLPDVPAIAKSVKPGPPAIVGPRGTLGATQARALLAREQRGAHAETLINSTVSLMESLSGRPLTTGNKVTLLVDGPATYQAIFKAIEAARDHINFETFIFNDDEVGRKFAEAFLKKQAEGVQVNLVYDAVGSVGTAAAFFDRLRDGGVNVLEFNPINPLKMRKDTKKLLLSQRDHRKVVIIDGNIAFTGGVNVSGVYYGSSASFDGTSHGSGEGWRDTHVRIEGPAVAELQRSFLETWRYQKGPRLATRSYFPRLENRGKSLVQAIPSYPGERHRLTYIMYLSAITNARYSIDLTTPYFVPDHEMRKAIARAAKRGVEVRIILPGRSDSNLALYAGHSYYADLMEAGARLFELRDRMLHAKTAVVDGIWSTVGSTNMDLWSFSHNNEINVLVVGKDFGDEMEALFERDVMASKEVTREEWSRRPLAGRARELLSRLLAAWL